LPDDIIDQDQYEPSENNDESNQEGVDARDELILTESELYVKFKEFRQNLFEEEKAILSEICVDIVKAYIQEQ
jgi:hypothetical protein